MPTKKKATKATKAKKKVAQKPRAAKAKAKAAPVAVTVGPRHAVFIDVESEFTRWLADRVIAEWGYKIEP